MNEQEIYSYYHRKDKRRQRIRAGEFEATSIGDLAFLLLIFFIVTSSFILRQGVFLSLPSKNAGTIRVEPDRLYHIYPTDNNFEEDGRVVNRKILGEKIRERLKKNKDLIVVVHMRKDIPYDRLIDSLSLAKESGVKKISLKDNE